ncbi:MAG: hypothetical protein KDD36_05410 [Flavobacteriales bacterium]|nr:hypothetical protein [Flavobacteriales bacterium]
MTTHPTFPSLRNTDVLLLSDQEIIFQKNRAFAALQDDLTIIRAELETLFNARSWKLPDGQPIPLTGRIHKGEKHHGLPWMVLDMPGIFNRESTFAFRILFLWGQGITCNLQLSGSWMDACRERLLNNQEDITDDKLYLATGKTPWDHQVVEDKYVVTTKWEREKIRRYLEQTEWIKLTTLLNMKDYGELEEFVLGWADRLFSAALD